MLLNNLSQNFVIYFPYNTFYPDVNDLFMPLMRRQYLPYNSIEDLINSQISSIDFPAVTANPVTLQNQMHQIQKRPGQDWEQLRSKTLSLNIKTSESLLTYFICQRQFEIFLKIGETVPLYMPNVCISLLDDGGFEHIQYVYKNLTPVSMSQLELSYASRIGQFTTFNWSFVYNYLEVWSYTDSKKLLITTDFEPVYDFPKEILTPNRTDLKQRQLGHQPISLQNSLSKIERPMLHSVSRFSGDHGLLSTTIKRN